MPLKGLLINSLHSEENLFFGEPSELYRLLGCPLPEFPSGEKRDDGQERLYVEFHRELKELFRRYLNFIIERIDTGAQEALAVKAGILEGDAGEYEEALVETLRHVVIADRRQGVVSLFWVGHSREAAEAVDAFFRETGAAGCLRYQMHPLLSGLYHRAEKRALDSLSRSEAKKADFQSGERQNMVLVRSVMDDQLPITEVDSRSFDAQKVLIRGNKRFHLGSVPFVELSEIFRNRLEEGIGKREKALVNFLASLFPSVVPQETARTGKLDRYIFQRPVVNYLLQDLDSVVPALTKSKSLRKECGRLGGWQHLLGGYQDLADCLLRSQLVSLLRNRLVFSGPGLGEGERREKLYEGTLFRFSRKAEVAGNLRKVTILFGDLRDFLKTSDRAISERDLAKELYRIFDPAAIVVKNFGGKMDKYLGDGFMATFGTQSGHWADPLLALRAAVAMQHMLSRLRELKKTDFRMGISLHTGLVAIARFFLDEERTEITPIGRQVNIAGRLCSDRGAKFNISEFDGNNRKRVEGTTDLSVSSGKVDAVTVDADNNLVNNGIAVSGSFLEELKVVADMKPFHEKDRHGYTFFDRETALGMCFEYVGEAMFKGLEGTISIYGLTADERMTSE